MNKLGSNSIDHVSLAIYISEPESRWTKSDGVGVTVRPSRGLETPDGFGMMAHEQPTSIPTSTSIGKAGRPETETRGVETTWSFGQQRKGISRPGEHPRLACPGVVQPPRWWISGNTDSMAGAGGRMPTHRSSTG